MGCTCYPDARNTETCTPDHTPRLFPEDGPYLNNAITLAVAFQSSISVLATGDS